MCGRYTVFDEEDIIEMKKIIDEVERRYYDSEAGVQGSFAEDGTAQFISSPIKKGEIFPSNQAPVLMPLPDGSGRAAMPMKWGFPKAPSSFAKENAKGGVIINARSETAGKLPMFRRCLRQRRVVIPSTGFYEWEHSGESRRKFLFRDEGGPMLYMAGLFNIFYDRDSEYAAFVILTREADRVVSRYHNRMPVILPQSKLDEWLYSEGKESEIDALMKLRASLVPTLAEG